MKKKKKVQSAKDILTKNDFVDRFVKSKKYISKEFQEYGLRLAVNLNDPKHKSLYLKLAKEVPRPYLDMAQSFAIDYPNSYNKGPIFMWKLKGVCKEHGYKIKLSGRKKKSSTVKATKGKKKKKEKKVKKKKVVKKETNVDVGQYNMF